MREFERWRDKSGDKLRGDEVREVMRKESINQKRGRGKFGIL